VSTGPTLIAGCNNTLAERLLLSLQLRHPEGNYRAVSLFNLYGATAPVDLGRCSVYVPSLDPHGTVPCLQQAGRVFRQLAHLDVPRLILISSAQIYGTGCNRQGMASEEYCLPSKKQNSICTQWELLESFAKSYLQGLVHLTVLRPVTVHPSSAALSRMLRSKLVLTVPGHDPMVQFLSIPDLADAVHCAVEREQAGVFNVAPDGAISLHAALRAGRRTRIPIPKTIQKLWKNKEVLEYLRYTGTVSNNRIKKELGFVPRNLSGSTVSDPAGEKKDSISHHPAFDEFGMDRDYINFYGKTLFRFLAKYYWRIEASGLENIPASGRGILAGTHRGFMPFDGVMVLNLLAQKMGRFPRFLTHPGLLKFPFLANFMTKLGGVLASQESAEHVLNSDELLAIFPEGIQGAFSYYREAYKIHSFGRHSFVKLALRNQAPIVPFVIVGSAEIFPILGKINCRIWSEYSGWPCIPITPTFPIAPLPLPSKWHIQFLPAIHVEQQYRPEAARDPAVVKAISLKVHSQMQEAFDRLLPRRRSMFAGSILEGATRAG
jgi:1-acyl-sn-glycerol-3-phosphate acyltransferase